MTQPASHCMSACSIGRSSIRQRPSSAPRQQRCADPEERCQWQEQRQGGLVQRVQRLEAEQSAAQTREQGQQTVIAGLQEQVGLMHSLDCAPVCLLSARLLARPRPLFGVLGWQCSQSQLPCAVHLENPRYGRQ